MYEKDILKDYIKNSELRIFSEKIKVRLSNDLAKKYDNGIYDNYLKIMQKCIDMIDSLNIKYPGCAKPILYIYIVPDDNYSKLLNIPKIFDNGKYGGKPVKCYDIDGFNSAYGLSQNILENTKNDEINISRFENQIHELSHLVLSQFFSKSQMISEGFAEALPLFGLDIENIFDEHRNAIVNLDDIQILTAKELIYSEKNHSFGEKELLPNKSCSFRLSYISSYLFVRGCIETIMKKYDFSKEKSIQLFLEILKQSNYSNEWLIYDIADNLEISKDELLNGKNLQMSILNSLKNNNIKSR